MRAPIRWPSSGGQGARNGRPDDVSRLTGHLPGAPQKSAHGPLTDGLARRGPGVTPTISISTRSGRSWRSCTTRRPPRSPGPVVGPRSATRSRPPAPTRTPPRSSSSAPASPGATPRAASAVCTGSSLRVRDLRDVRAPADVARECVTHLREPPAAAGSGRRSRCSRRTPGPSGPADPQRPAHPVRRVPHRTGGCAATRATRLHRQRAGRGWTPPEPRGRFDVLPLMIGPTGGRRSSIRLPADAVLEVPLEHPELRVVRRAGAALARGAGDQQHALDDRRRSPTPRHRSTGGTWAPRSGRATSPTPTATTCCRWRGPDGAGHPLDRGRCGGTGRWSS